MKKNKTGGTLGINLSILLTASFILAIIIFASQFANDNNAYVSVEDNNQGLYNTGIALNGTITTYQEGNNQTLIAVYGGEVQDGSDSLDRVSSFETGAEDAQEQVLESTRSAIGTIFGSNQNILWIVAGFTALLGLTIALYAWKTFKQGAPE